MKRVNPPVLTCYYCQRDGVPCTHVSLSEQQWAQLIAVARNPDKTVIYASYTPTDNNHTKENTLRTVSSPHTTILGP